MNVLALASVTIREALRRKLQVNLLAFGLLLVVSSIAVSSLTVGEQYRIVSDLSLTAMSITGILIATFLGAGLVAGDIERRVIYPVIAKPVSRAEYIVGRYLGLCAALLVNLAVMSLALALVLGVTGGSSSAVLPALAGAVAMLTAKFVVVAAVAVFFSCVTNSTLAAIFALCVAIAGHLTNDMRALWKGDAEWIPRVLWYALPNLGSLTANESVVYKTALPASTWIAALYAVLYAATVIALASVAFERRDLR
jgi:ABC-type transport system involved in multi-copper enzyme maturation permease subunit